MAEQIPLDTTIMCWLCYKTLYTDEEAIEHIMDYHAIGGVIEIVDGENEQGTKFRRIWVCNEMGDWFFGDGGRDG